MSVDDDSPLPLSRLRRWMSKDVASWIHDGDLKQARLEKELIENAAMNASNLFGSSLDSEFEEATRKGRRVQEWRSSSSNRDGIGGFEPQQPQGKEQEENSVKIVFILSESYQGFGDTLWSSARYLANVLANKDQCREMLAPMLAFGVGKEMEGRSPLFGRSFVELGAGAGVPSWAAMCCGARVVCTDLSDTNRIRSMGECVERNFKMMETNEGEEILLHCEKTRVCPHDWGTPVDPVVRALNEDGDERFDVVVAADCCYMPWIHTELLDSIYDLMSPHGVAIISFALHSNTDDEDVWLITDRAIGKGFHVEVLPSGKFVIPWIGHSRCFGTSC